MRIPAFWDTSALVPLCVHQGITPACISLYRSHAVVVWWAAPVEIAGALARLVRMQQISSGQWAEARKIYDILRNSWSVVQPSDGLRARAVQLVERYDLRAADSLQLAAALEWCEDAPQGRSFLSADGRLREAALQGGFDARKI
jgi:predicted nucleic acid-binding protein